jgi:hypothetical protein
LNPERVLKGIQKPPVVESSPSTIKSKSDPLCLSCYTLETPKTSDNLAAMRRHIEISLAGQKTLDAHTKLSIQKVVNAAENGFADRALLLEENSLLFEQNNEKAVRTSTKSTVVGTARVMSYEDIVEAQKKRDMREVKASLGRGRPKKRGKSTPAQILGKRSRSEEREEALNEIRASGLEGYCSVLSLY